MSSTKIQVFESKNTKAWPWNAHQWFSEPKKRALLCAALYADACAGQAMPQQEINWYAGAYLARRAHVLSAYFLLEDDRILALVYDPEQPVAFRRVLDLRAAEDTFLAAMVAFLELDSAAHTEVGSDELYDALKALAHRKADLDMEG